MEDVKATCTQCAQKFYVKDPLYPRGPKVPLILACDHLVCEKCLTSALRQKCDVTCKKCDHISTGEGINALQIKDVMKEYPLHLNLLGMFARQHQSLPVLEDSAIRFIPAGAPVGLQSAFKKASMSSGVKKAMCDECPLKEAVWNCKPCSMVYCNACFNKVHKFKANRMHEKVALFRDTAAANRSKPPVSELVRTCKDHPLKKLEFFCRDCDECVCSLCTVPTDSAHRTHNVVAVTEMNEEYFPVLQTSLEDAGSILKRLRNAEHALSDRSSNPTMEHEATPTAVAQHYVNHFAWVHAALQRKEAQILEKLALSADEANKMKDAAKEIVLQHIAYTTDLMQRAEEILENVVTSDLPCLVTLTQDLQNLQSLPCQLAIHTGDSQLRCEANESMVKELLSHYDVEFPTMQDLKLVKIDDIGADWLPVEVPEDASLSMSASTSVVSSSRASSVCDLDLGENRTTLAVAEGSVINEPPAPTRGYIPPKTQETVKVCHIKDPSNFYVLRIPDAKFLQDLSQRLQKSVMKQRQINSKEAIPGQMFLVRFSVDKKWYRGRVRTVPRTIGTADLVEVSYVDYGNFDVVALTEMRSLPHEFTTIPPLALQCTLAKARPLAGGKWDDQAVKWLAKIADNTHFTCSVYAFNGGIYEVDLGQMPGDLSKGIPLSVADALVFLEFGQKADESSVVDLVIQQSGFLVENKRTTYYLNQTFKTGQEVDVMVSNVEDPHHVYVQRMDDSCKYIVAYTDQLTTMYASNERNPIYSPTAGMACAAIYPTDRRWYRAKVIGLPGHRQVEILYVDYGNKATVMYTDVRSLPEKFMRAPPLAVLCSLADVAPTADKWTAEATKAVIDAALDKVMKLYVLAENSDGAALSVLLKEMKPTEEICINYLLVCDGHAVSTGEGSSAITSPKYPALTEQALEMMREQPKIVNPAKKVSRPKKSSSKAPRLPLVTPATKKVDKQCPVRIHAEVSPKAKAITETTWMLVNGSPQLVEESPQLTEKTPQLEGGSPKMIKKEPFRIQVQIVKSISPDTIFVSLPQNIKLVKEMMDEMSIFYEHTFPQPQHIWQENQVCAVYRESDKKWHRGIFISCYDSNFALVTLRDIATKDYIKLNNLRCLDDRFKLVRDGAFLCHLAGIVPAGGAKWSQMACEYMQNFFSDHTSFYIAKKGEVKNQSLPIELMVVETICEGPLTPITELILSLNKNLVDQGLAIPIRGANEVPLYSVREVMEELEGRVEDEECFSNIPLQAVPPSTDNNSDDSEPDVGNDYANVDWLSGPNMDLISFDASPTYIDHMGYVYLHDYVEARQGVLEVQAKLQDRFANSKPNLDWKWEPKQMCIAKFHLDGNWYRARTVKLEESGDWKVVFVDYGNEGTCAEIDMRPSDYLRQIPIQCHKCYLSNIAPIARDGRWTIEGLDFLHQLVVDQRCTVTLESAAGLPDPIPIQILRFDGLNISTFMVSNNHARYVQSLKPALPPSKLMEAIEKVSPKKTENMTMAESVSPQPGPSRTTFEHETECNNPNNDGIYYGAGDMACGPKLSWADEVEVDERVQGVDVEYIDDDVENFEDEVDDVETCSSNSSTNYVTINKTLHDSAKLNSWKEKKNVESVSGRDVKSATFLRSDSGCSDAVSSVSSRDVATCSESEEEEEVFSADDNEGLEGNEHREESAESPTLTADDETTTSGVTTPDVYEDAIQMKEASVASTVNERKTSASRKGQTDPMYFNESNFPAEDEFLVMVKDVVSPVELKVTILNDDSNSRIEELMELEEVLQVEAPKQPQLYQPFSGMLCAAYVGDKWIRAAVNYVDVVAHLITVEGIDHACGDNLAPDCVLQLKKEWSVLPPMLLSLQLWNVAPAEDYSPIEAMEYLSQAIINKPLTAQVKARQPMMFVNLLELNGSSLAYQTLIDAAIYIKTDEEN